MDTLKFKNAAIEWHNACGLGPGTNWLINSRRRTMDEARDELFEAGMTVRDVCDLLNSLPLPITWDPVLTFSENELARIERIYPHAVEGLPRGEDRKRYLEWFWA